jgi:hypothetical protein
LLEAHGVCGYVLSGGPLVVMANVRHQEGHLGLEWYGPTPKSGSFWMGGPSSLASSGGVVPGSGCMVPQPFCR